MCFVAEVYPTILNVSVYSPSFNRRRYDPCLEVTAALLSGPIARIVTNFNGSPVSASVIEPRNTDKSDALAYA